jgi:hypothetical protein
MSKKENFKIVKEKFTAVEKYLNGVEEELRKPEGETNLKVVSWFFGKLQEQYKEIARLLEIFQPLPKG